jgi:hypothetical protein
MIDRSGCVIYGHRDLPGIQQVTFPLQSLKLQAQTPDIPHDRNFMIPAALLSTLFHQIMRFPVLAPQPKSTLQFLYHKIYWHELFLLKPKTIG